MTAEIKTNSDNSVTIKHLTYEQLQGLNTIFGNPMESANEPVNQTNQQYQSTPVEINGKRYAYSVYDATNNGENTYTIVIQIMRD